MSKYVGDFGDWNDVKNGFTYDSISDITLINLLETEPDKVFYAEYENGGYEGAAAVTWVNGEKFYFLHNSHCSCYGLYENPSLEVFGTQEEFVAYLKTRQYGVEERAALYTLGRLW